MTKILDIKNLNVAYQNKIVLSHVNMEISEGARVAIVGPNGAGKTTLLHAMLALIPVLSGQVHFFDCKYHLVKSKIAFVPQRSTIDWTFPITVYDVVKMGRFVHRNSNQSKKEHDEIVMNALAMVDLIEYRHRQISMLSGGQQQRVFLARALAQEAQLYILDEPFQGVDAKSEQSMMSIFKLLKSQGKTIIMVQHDLDKVQENFDEVILLNKSIVAQGKTCSVFTPELLSATFGCDFKTQKYGVVGV